MPIHIEHNVIARRERGLHRLGGRSIEISKHLGPLQEIAARSQLLKLVARYEIIIGALSLLWARLPRRHRNGMAKRLIAREQEARQRGFTSARWRRQNKADPAPKRRLRSVAHGGLSTKNRVAFKIGSLEPSGIQHNADFVSAFAPKVQRIFRPRPRNGGH